MTSLVDRTEIDKLLIIGGALRAGLIDAVAAAPGADAEEVARGLGADLRACRIMLEALRSLGVMTNAGKGYALTETARLHLVEPPPGDPLPPELERSSLLHQLRKARGMLDLPYVIAHGRHPERDPAERDLRSFVRTMGEGDPERIAEVVERCLAYAGRVESMIDVGGAVGHVALAFAERGVPSTLFDRPAVLPEAREFLGEAASGIEMVEGDFTKALPPGPFGLAYLGNIAHIYGPETDAALVARAAASLAPGGVIAIRDLVWERSPRAALFAVNMLQATVDGGVWRESDYRAWLEAAGFIDVQVVDLSNSDSQLVLGRLPAA